MHIVALDPGLVARLTAERGGQLHVFGHALDPARTAHLVIDMQNGFLEEGAPVEVPVARAIVPNVNRIARAVRAAGGRNVWVRFTTRPDSRERWSNFYARFSPEVAAGHQAAFSPGAHHHALWPALEVADGDWTVDKGRFGAFIPGTCDLDAMLREAGIDTLIVTGTLTNCCCESTARDAMQLNYKVVFVADANATLSDAEHNATLNNMAALFCDVMTTDEVVAALARPAERCER